MKIVLKFLLAMLSVSLIPIMITGFISLNNMAQISKVTDDASNKLVDTLTEQSRNELSRSAEILADKINIYVNNYKKDIALLSKHPSIPKLMSLAEETGRVEDTRETEPDKSKQVARHYPADKHGAWQEVYDYFMDVYKERSDEVDMIRIFHADGFVINGVALGEEDVRDYKGDKSWFKETMDDSRTAPSEYLVSPISIARRTGTTAIRYTTPLEDLNGKRVGLMIINFKAKAITESITDFKFGKSGYAMLLDKAYENAEGDITKDWVVTIAQPTPDGKQYEIKEDREHASFVSQSQLVEDKGFFEYDKDGKKWIASYYKVPNNRREWYVVVTAPLYEIQAAAVTAGEDINKTVSSTKKIILCTLFVTLIVAVAAVLLGMYMAKKVAGPIKSLKDAADKVTSGEDIQLPAVKGNDEVAELTGSMAMLIEALKFAKKGNKGDKK